MVRAPCILSALQISMKTSERAQRLLELPSGLSERPQWRETPRSLEKRLWDLWVPGREMLTSFSGTTAIFHVSARHRPCVRRRAHPAAVAVLCSLHSVGDVAHGELGILRGAEYVCGFRVYIEYCIYSIH